MKERPVCISVHQPWAWAIFNAETDKDVENRDWKTNVRQRVFIHASKACTKAEYDEAVSFIHDVCPRVVVPSLEELPRGGVVGYVRIVGCVTHSHSPWFTGKYGFVMREKRTVPFTEVGGQQGFFVLNDDVVSEIRKKIARAA